MQFPLFARILTAAALVSPLAIWPTPTVTETRAPVFTADRDACYGRVYDAAHLKSHPQQKVTSLHVLRSLERRREAENWTPDARTEAIRSFREEGQTSVTAFVTFRDRKGIFHNSLTCDKETRDGVRCMIECDGGSFRLARSGANAVMLHNNGFVLIGGCGEETSRRARTCTSTRARTTRCSGSTAKPIAACRAEEQKATPIPAGVPLRERFKEDEQFCFGRDYDAAHLAKQPEADGVADPRRPARARQGTGRRTPSEMVVVQREARRLGDAALESQTTTVRYACSPQEATGSAPHGGDTPSACSDRSIQLVRGPGDEILLRIATPACRSTKNARRRRPASSSDSGR